MNIKCCIMPDVKKIKIPCVVCNEKEGEVKLEWSGFNRLIRRDVVHTHAITCYKAGDSHKRGRCRFGSGGFIRM